MPSHKVHEAVSRLLLGRAYPEVDDAIDEPYVLLGRAHRKLYHDPFSAMIVASIVSHDPNAKNAALLHILLDEACSKDGRLSLLVELLANRSIPTHSLNKWVLAYLIARAS
jgi:hypothetical protein